MASRQRELVLLALIVGAIVYLSGAHRQSRTSPAVELRSVAGDAGATDPVLSGGPGPAVRAGGDAGQFGPFVPVTNNLPYAGGPPR